MEKNWIKTNLLLYNAQILCLRIFLAISVFQFLVSCNVKVSNSPLIGTWNLTYNPSTKYVFKESGSFKSLILDSVEMYKKNSSKFKLVNTSDTLWLYTKYKFYSWENTKTRNFNRKMAIRLNNDYLTMLTYKNLPGIRNHIDEYSIWVKEVPSPVKVEYKGQKIIYILPNGFKGKVWIAFNQKNGESPTYDSLENPILKIPKNGLLQTSLHEDAFATANKHYTIVSTNEKGQLLPLTTFDKFDQNVDHKDSTCCEKNKIYAFMGGFNQRPREHINTYIFGKPITGNVMYFYVGTHKNWAKEDNYMIEVKSD